MIVGRRLHSVRGGDCPDRADREMGVAASMQGGRGMAGLHQRRGERVSRAVQGSRLCQTVSDALASPALPPSRLELEITETDAVTESGRPRMRRAANCGRSVYASRWTISAPAIRRCATCRSFPIDQIKIDGCFVHDLLSKHDSRAIIQAVVQLASSLGMKTTAEGVETQGRERLPQARRLYRSPGVPVRQARAPEICPCTVAVGRSEGKIEHGMMARGRATRDHKDDCGCDLAPQPVRKRWRPPGR